MTEQEIDHMHEMWLGGAKIADIARDMCYSKSTVYKIMRNDRDRFPLRNRRINDHKMEVWIARILAGRATISDVMTDMRVSRSSVEKRLYRAKTRLAEKEGA